MRTLKLIYLNITFYLVFTLFSIISIPFAALLVTLMSFFTSQRNTLRRIRLLIGWYGLFIIRVIPFPFVRIKYKDSFKNGISGPYIFVSNHRAASDAFLIAQPCMPIECIQVVNIWPFKVPILGPLARLAGYLSVNQMSFEEFAQKTSKLLRQGISIIVFPEGSRSGSKNMKQFYSSIFRIALKTKHPIVPVCISGNEHIPSRGSFLLRPGTIRIHKLPAVQWRDYQHLTPFVLKNRIRNAIAQELANQEEVSD